MAPSTDPGHPSHVFGGSRFTRVIRGQAVPLSRHDYLAVSRGFERSIILDGCVAAPARGRAQNAVCLGGVGGGLLGRTKNGERGVI